MDTSFTYSSNTGQRVMLYAPPEMEPPETLQMVCDAERVTVYRISDRPLECGKAGGGCGSTDCHRRVLGKCQCGLHDAVGIEKAVR